MLCKIRVVVVACLLALGAPSWSQPAAKPSTCALRVHITDEDGGPLPKAFVLIHAVTGANQQFTPDKNGKVKASLHAGMYDLFVSASGFNPQAQIVDLRACKPVDLNLMLTLDSERSANDGL